MTRTVVRPALALGVLLVAVTGCGTKADDGDPVAGEVTETPTASAKPTETPSETPSTPDASPTTTPPPSLEDRLLDAAQLPGFNEEFTWSNGKTTDAEGTDLAGTCHKFELTSIGAMQVAKRTYQPAVKSDADASSVVAKFPDVKTAKRAYAVLGSWREQCAEDGREVGAFVPLDLGSATGGWYLLTYGSTFDAQGFARAGAHIVMVTMKLEGEDYNYPPGEEPMVGALTEATTQLG